MMRRPSRARRTADTKRRHYLKHRSLILARIRRRQNEARRFVRRHLRRHPCVDCPVTDIRVLEFDHVRGTKRAAVSTLVNRGSTLEIISAEIAKCDVRCANCHRLRHWRERQVIGAHKKKMLANLTQPD